MAQTQLSIQNSNDKELETKEIRNLELDSIFSLDSDNLDNHSFIRHHRPDDWDTFLGQPLSPVNDCLSDLIFVDETEPSKPSTQPDLRNLDTFFHSDLLSDLRRISRSQSSRGSMATADDTSSTSSRETTINWIANPPQAHDGGLTGMSSHTDILEPDCSAREDEKSHAEQHQGQQQYQSIDSSYQVPTNTPSNAPPTPPSASMASTQWASPFLHGTHPGVQNLSEYSCMRLSEFGHMPAEYLQTPELDTDHSGTFNRAYSDNDSSPSHSRNSSLQTTVYSPEVFGSSTFTSPDSETDLPWGDCRGLRLGPKESACSPSFDQPGVAPQWWSPDQTHVGSMSNMEPERQLQQDVHALQIPTELQHLQQEHSQDVTMYSGTGLNFSNQPAEFSSQATVIANIQIPARSRPRPLLEPLKLTSEHDNSPMTSPKTPQRRPKSGESATPSPRTPQTPRSGRSLSAGVSRKNKTASTPRGGRSAAPGFVNLTPGDSQRILTGVAPSGSSKTKARREKEALEKRRRASQAARYAVESLGGDPTSLLGHEFFNEGGSSSSTEVQIAHAEYGATHSL